MSAPPSTAQRNLKNADLILYSTAALLGIGIVACNYQIAPERKVAMSPVNAYLERIIHRMDSVSSQLSVWGAVDIQKEKARY